MKTYLDRQDSAWIAAAGAVTGVAVYVLGRALEPDVTELPAWHYRRAVDAFSDAAGSVRESPVSAIAAVGAIAAGIWFFAGRRQRTDRPGVRMVEQAIEVHVPVSTAYNQWTQFEEFPRFMESVESVRQLDDTHLHWRATVAGKTKEWDSEITQQVPDERIAWRSTSGPYNAGEVTFDKVGENRTRIVLQMAWEPESTDERVAGALGAVRLTTRRNLQKFKELVEAMGVETGAWRGTVGATH